MIDVFINIEKTYRVNIIILIEKNNKIDTVKEYLDPNFYTNKEDAQNYIQQDINYKLQYSLFFRSQKQGFDLVKYSKEASVNTYILYEIVSST